MSTPPYAIGVDAGATLCKLVYWGDVLDTAQFPAGEYERIAEFLRRPRLERVVATGGGAEAFAAILGDVAFEHDLEFAAWARGAPVLAARQGVELPRRYLLVSIGTGTSVLAVAGSRFRRVGGTALGGGALLGLGQLLLRVERFEEICELASRGDRRKVDLLVGDIYADPRFPLPSELNAASFAKLDSRAPEDLAHALACMIGENVGLICAELARTERMDCVVYGGSTLSQNPALEDVLRQRAAEASQTCVFLEQGAFCGAIGAAVKQGALPDEPLESRPARS